MEDNACSVRLPKNSQAEAVVSRNTFDSGSDTDCYYEEVKNSLHLTVMVTTEAIPIVTVAMMKIKESIRR